MKQEHISMMISKLLAMAGDIFENHGCNDLPDDFYEGMEDEDIKELHKQYHSWNGDPEEYDEEDVPYLGDSSLMSFFSDYILHDEND